MKTGKTGNRAFACWQHRSGNVCGSSSHFYGDKPGIVHIQFKGSYNLKITDKYTLPLHAMVMFNPEGDRAFYQIGTTLFSF